MANNHRQPIKCNPLECAKLLFAWKKLWKWKSFQKKLYKFAVDSLMWSQIRYMYMVFLDQYSLGLHSEWDVSLLKLNANARRKYLQKIKISQLRRTFLLCSISHPALEERKVLTWNLPVQHKGTRSSREVKNRRVEGRGDGNVTSTRGSIYKMGFDQGKGKELMINRKHWFDSLPLEMETNFRSRREKLLLLT